jgi:hypothetical protein
MARFFAYTFPTRTDFNRFVIVAKQWMRPAKPSTIASNRPI